MSLHIQSFISRDSGKAPPSPVFGLFPMATVTSFFPRGNSPTHVHTAHSVVALTLKCRERPGVPFLKSRYTTATFLCVFRSIILRQMKNQNTCFLKISEWWSFFAAFRILHNYADVF
jgi:hypothetical protein